VATPAIIVVVSIAVLTIFALGLTLVYLLTHLRRLTSNLRQMQTTLQPTLQSLARDTEVTRRELERVSQAAAQLQEERERGA
jgi:predicted PurR-regulated permease PerM